MKQTNSRTKVQAQAPSGAQGTIEYLVIVAVVVVIGLVVVGLLMNMTGSGTGLSSNSSKINNKVGSGGLNIIGAVTDSNGDGIFSVGNTSGETITLTKVATGGVENTFSQTIPIGSSVALGINSLDLKCPCVAGQTKVSCDYNISYTSGGGLPKTILVTVQADCVSDSATTAAVVPPVMTVTNSDCWSDTTNPHPICTLNDLNRIRGTPYLDWNYELKADINAAATKTWADVNGFIPIGDVTTRYTGNFNGNNHYISSLYIYRPSTNSVGLFGLTFSTSRIQNVGLRDLNITGGYFAVGGLVGTGTGSVSGCYTTGMVTSIGQYVAGLIGNNSGQVVNSYSSVSVTGVNSSIGGLLGNSSGSVLNSYATGRVSATTGASYVGGLIGQGSGLVSGCYATGSVTGGWSVGGLIGYGQGSVLSSYASGSVTGLSSVGGLIGSSWSGSFLSSSYATGSVTGGTSVGGLLGNSSGLVLSSYATGDVNGTGSYVGGLIGQDSNGVRNSFSKGTVDSKKIQVRSLFPDPLL